MPVTDFSSETSICDSGCSSDSEVDDTSMGDYSPENLEFDYAQPSQRGYPPNYPPDETASAVVKPVNPGRSSLLGKRTRNDRHVSCTRAVGNDTTPQSKVVKYAASLDPKDKRDTQRLLDDAKQTAGRAFDSYANQPFILIVRGNRDPSEYAAAMANDLKYRNQAPILESLPDYGPSTDQQGRLLILRDETKHLQDLSKVLRIKEEDAYPAMKHEEYFLQNTVPQLDRLDRSLERLKAKLETLMNPLQPTGASAQFNLPEYNYNDNEFRHCILNGFYEIDQRFVPLKTIFDGL